MHVLLLFALLLSDSHSQDTLFELTTTSPNHPEFNRQLEGLYGIHSAIEPKLEKKDLPLYQKVYPLLSEQPDQAIQILNQAVDENSHPSFDFLLGLLTYQKGELQKAHQHFRTCLKKSPNFRRAIRLQSILAFRNSNYPKCLELTLKVIALGGGDAQTYGLLAYTHYTQGHLGSALQAYQMAKVFKPDLLDFKVGEAYCHLQLKNHHQAIGLFDELVSEHPEQSQLWLALANAHLALDQLKEAAVHLEIAKGFHRDHFELHHLLSQIYLKQAIPHLSLKEILTPFNFQRELKPSEVKSILYILKHYLHLQWFEQAKQLTQHLKNKLPQDLPRTLVLSWKLAQANLKLQTNELDGIQALLETILIEQPLNGTALILISKFYSKKSKPDQAIKYLKRAIHIDEVKKEAHLELGQIYTESRDLKNAIQIFEKLYQIQADQNLFDHIQQLKKVYKAQ